MNLVHLFTPSPKDYMQINTNTLRYPFTVAGKPWLDYLREVSYKDEIKEFKDVLTKIGLKQGWTLSDLKNMFSNEMFDQIYFDDVALPTSRGAGSTTVLGSDKVGCQLCYISTLYFFADD